MSRGSRLSELQRHLKQAGINTPGVAENLMEEEVTAFEDLLSLDKDDLYRLLDRAGMKMMSMIKFRDYLTKYNPKTDAKKKSRSEPVLKCAKCDGNHTTDDCPHYPVTCDKCDGNHATALCPHYPKQREVYPRSYEPDAAGRGSRAEEDAEEDDDEEEDTPLDKLAPPAAAAAAAAPGKGEGKLNSNKKAPASKAKSPAPATGKSGKKAPALKAKSPAVIAAITGKDAKGGKKAPAAKAKPPAPALETSGEKASASASSSMVESVGDLSYMIWARVQGYRWWPAWRADPTSEKHVAAKPEEADDGEGHEFVVFWGKQQSFAWVRTQDVVPYKE